ncbi:hypothetical protein CF70_012480 [Cupriavidus sp. SK-3]|jgi:hypothetical protein|uniref:hypothetical protein n=1 Tax=Cupriavidus sp. SK-3 TaxID=1470558 RepID=UPI00044789C3|nr:hypothetical protein [Cupriavidus sp. SK-3]KDP85704.1 hypothetical protein CF70_012480 [Cupriavidus sp. SK-3]
MSQPRPGPVLSRQLPPTVPAFPKTTKVSMPACLSRMPVHMPATPAPMMTIWFPGAADAFNGLSPSCCFLLVCAICGKGMARKRTATIEPIPDSGKSRCSMRAGRCPNLIQALTPHWLGA